MHHIFHTAKNLFTLAKNIYQLLINMGVCNIIQTWRNSLWEIWSSVNIKFNLYLSLRVKLYFCRMYELLNLCIHTNNWYFHDLYLKTFFGQFSYEFVEGNVMVFSLLLFLYYFVCVCVGGSTLFFKTPTP